MRKVYLAGLGLGVLVLLFMLGVSGVVVKNRLLISGREVDRWRDLGEGVTGQFVAEKEGVNIVMVPMKNPGLADMGSYELKLVSEGTVVVSLPFSGYNVGDPAEVKFQFEPVRGVVGKKMSVVVAPVSGGGGKMLVGVDDRGEMVFRVYRRVGGRAEGLAAAVVNFGSRVGGDRVFLVYWLGLLGVVCGSLVYAGKK